MNDSFVFYRSWLEIIEQEYTDAETREKLVYAIVMYGVVGKKTYPAEKMFLKQCYAQIDSAIARHEKAVVNGKKGGAPKGNKNASKGQKQAEVDLEQPNENDNSNDNENDNSNDNSNENINNSIRSGSPSYGETATEEKYSVFEKDKDGRWLFNGVPVQT